MLDADATFDVSRLAAALRARISSASSAAPASNDKDDEIDDGIVDAAVSAALSRFGLLTCHSALELLSALATLRASIERLSGEVEGGGSPRCRLVLLDNAAAFYWPLRASASAAARNARRRQLQQLQPFSPASAPDPGSQLTLATMAAASSRALRRALKGSGAAAIVTRHAVFPQAAATAATATDAKFGGGGGGGQTKSEFFPQSWLSLASRRADLAPAGFSASAGEGGRSGGRMARVRLTWRPSAGVASAASTSASTLLLDLNDAGLLPSSF